MCDCPLALVFHFSRRNTRIPTAIRFPQASSPADIEEPCLCSVRAAQEGVDIPIAQSRLSFFGRLDALLDGLSTRFPSGLAGLFELRHTVPLLLLQLCDPIPKVVF